MSITSIAEEMVRREYNRKLITLPNKFWNLPEYKVKYQMQLRFAAKFIRAYGEEAVQNVVNRETWCFSLAAKKLPDMIEVEANAIKKGKMIQELTKLKTSDDIEGIPEWRPPVSNKRNILDE